MKKSTSLVIDLAIIGLISAVFIWINLVWMKQYAATPQGDYAHHFVEAAAFWNAMHYTPNFFTGLLTAWVWPSSYPAGMYIITYLLSLFTHPGIDTCLASQAALLPILFGSLYYSFRQQHGIASATAAAVLATAWPSYIVCSNSYLLDFPSSVFACLCLCLLGNCQNFSRRSATLWFGLALGYGILMKYTLVWFVLPPLLVLSIQQLKRWFQHRLQFCLNLAMLAIAVIIPYAVSRNLNRTSEDICNHLTLLPPRTYILLGIMVLLALAWYLAAKFCCRKTSDATIVNVSQSLCLAYLVCAPWFICNSDIVSDRASPLGPEAAHNLQLSSLGESLWSTYMDMPGPLYATLILIGLLLAFTRQSDLFEKLNTWAIAVGTFMTYMVVGFPSRYISPSEGLANNAIVGALRHLPGGPILGILLGVLLMASNILSLTFADPSQPTPEWLDETYRFTHRLHVNNQEAANSHFAIGWNLAPKLTPKQYPFSLVLVPCTLANNGDSNSVLHGLQTYSEFHEHQILPVQMDLDTDRNQQLVMFSIPRMRTHLVNSYPKHRELLESILSPNADVSHVVWDYIVEAPAPEYQPLDASRVGMLLKSAYVRTTITTKNAKVTVYRRADKKN